jgi:hypothetical protein
LVINNSKGEKNMTEETTPEVTPVPKPATLTNKEFCDKNDIFRDACEEVKIEPTTRQASKWRMKKGKAWKNHFGSQPKN